MRLLFIADGRSPIALNWIEYFIGRGDEVYLASTFQCLPPLGLASLEFIPVAFSSARPTPTVEKTGGRNQGGVLWGAPAIKLRTTLRHWLGPLTLPGAARKLHASVDRLQPDLVHAMRIPYEGMLAGLAATAETGFPPLVVSVWGNDFTLNAPSTPFMARYTRLALQAADGLHSDCYRDARLAEAWGFRPDKPVAVLPGAGGVQPETFHPPVDLSRSPTPLVVNPRGFRSYVRNDTFFQAIPLVLKKHPDVRFACPTMQGEAQVEGWVAALGIGAQVDLLPRLARSQMAILFQQAHVTVSPSVHDGTPNTLLEAMACGSFPIAGDLESLREWIMPGVNGLLFDPADPQALAGAICQALDDQPLRERAMAHNQRLIAARATFSVVMGQAEDFYRTIIQGSSQRPGAG